MHAGGGGLCKLGWRGFTRILTYTGKKDDSGGARRQDPISYGVFGLLSVFNLSVLSINSSVDLQRTGNCNLAYSVLMLCFTFCDAQVNLLVLHVSKHVSISQSSYLSNGSMCNKTQFVWRCSLQERTNKMEVWLWWTDNRYS